VQNIKLNYHRYQHLYIAKGQGLYDNGGTVRVAGGSAYNGYGGAISISSGLSQAHSSGSVAINSANSGFTGSSGEAEIFTGRSIVGDSGHITLDTGESMYGRGGDISLKVGNGTGQQNGGNVKVKAGDIQAADGAPRGGNIDLIGGRSTNGDSGRIHIKSERAGIDQGSSGLLSFQTGRSTNGDTGAIHMKTGSAAGGTAGAFVLQVGSTEETGSENLKGSDIFMSAGLALDKGARGGAITLVGGEGRHRDKIQGGSGGNINLKGGASWGGSTVTNVGGHVDITGGFAVGGSGGDVHLRSGLSKFSNSGNIGILTPHGGNEGHSGQIGLVTGLSRKGDSGGIVLQTGHASEKASTRNRSEGASGKRYLKC
jgi:hypothetical protein